jgi:hypothetical protein
MLSTELSLPEISVMINNPRLDAVPPFFSKTKLIYVDGLNRF